MSRTFAKQRVLNGARKFQIKFESFGIYYENCWERFAIQYKIIFKFFTAMS